MNLSDSVRFYWPSIAVTLTIAILVALVVFWLLKISRKGAPSNQQLAIVDLISYALAGASVIAFFLGSAIDEAKLRAELALNSVVIDFGDAYDPLMLLPQIRAAIKESCPSDPNCKEIDAELDSWNDHAMPYTSRIKSGGSAPYQVKELVAKYNYGFDSTVRPAFSNDNRGRMALLILVLISSAYLLGIWRRVHIVLISKQA